MYIRLECGKLAYEFESGRFHLLGDSNGIIYVIENDKNKKRVLIGYFGRDAIVLNIKSQGEDLIDVLEVGDIVYYNYCKSDWFDIGIISIIPYKGSSIKFRNGLLNTKHNHKILKIITHEQYLPLAQEVK